jgi:transposase
VLGAVKNVTVSLSCGKWFVSIQTEREVEQRIAQGGAVGIDMGIARFATLSDGTYYAPLGSLKCYETALRKAQRAMSRKTKFSNNWKDSRQTQARFECVECGFEENADVVGAINVLRAGHARLACADTSPEVGASGQEPAEATHSGSMPG